MTPIQSLIPLLGFVLLAALHRIDAGVPLPYEPVMSEGIRDPVFAYLVAMADDDARGELSGKVLDSLVVESGRRSRLPHRFLSEIVRRVGPPDRPAELRISFAEPLRLPVPYSILGYHPGSLRISDEVELDEWSLGRVRLPDGPDGKRRYLEEVKLLVVRRGELVIDIDWWIDKLFGGKLDDTDIVALALVRFEGGIFGIATGYNSSGRGRSGTFDFFEDEIVFPSPSHFKFAGRTLRGRAERLRDRAKATAHLGIRSPDQSALTSPQFGPGRE
ncbi:MAG: hypothetical protein CME06_15085 [Gemmatimonadetes bacterium]|nr:hypothetical protein [Gemmatimonadota bacterium]